MQFHAKYLVKICVGERKCQNHIDATQNENGMHNLVSTIPFVFFFFVYISMLAGVLDGVCHGVLPLHTHLFIPWSRAQHP